MPLKVLYLPAYDPSVSSIPDDAAKLAFARAGRHELIVFDHSAHLEPQFEGIDVVIDLGGSVGTRRMLHAATSVRLWQVLGYGLDHFDLDYWASRGMVTAHCPGPNSAVALAEFAMMQSFLGLGAQEPDPSWGAMLATSRRFLRSAPYYGIIPGVAVTYFVVAVNLAADGLRVLLDPRAKRHQGPDLQTGKA